MFTFLEKPEEGTPFSFAFVRFRHEDEATTAIQVMNGKEVDKCRLYVSAARPRQCKDLHVAQKDGATGSSCGRCRISL